jgi:hypothetical protein
MKKYIEIYFLFLLKPTLLILCSLSNYLYLRNSQFTNDFYFIIYCITFAVKPLFFLLLFAGSLVNYKITSIIELTLTLFIVIAIYFGFPVKEYLDYLKIDTAKRVYLNLGEDYRLREYLTTHYVVNLLVENLPVMFFIIINNIMMESKTKRTIIDPIIVNSIYGIFNGVMVCGCFWDNKNLHNN